MADKYIFKKELADRAVRFIETRCSHAKGEWAGRPLALAEWQKEKIIRPLFGWIEAETGLRKYRRCFVFIPRKNGKSTLGAAIALYLMSADQEPGAEIYSAAADHKQASLIHEVAKIMVGNDPGMQRRFQIYINSIMYPKTNSFYQVLSADVKTKHGKNSHGIIFDELHAQPNRDLWDVLTTSTGSRRQPMVISFTTAGFDRNTICYEQYDYAKKVQAGVIKDDNFLPVIYEADPEDDFQNTLTWAKANPNLGISLKPEYVKAECQRAVNEASYENTFRRLQLNQWTTSEIRWIPDEHWMACKEEMPELANMECYGGLDLASTRDICALVLLFPFTDGSFAVLPFFFIPELSARERTRKDGVNYDTWIRQGLMIETPGNVTDYDYIQEKIKELAERYQIKSIAYDRYNASQLVIRLQADGFKMSPMGQGFVSMNTPTKELEKLVYQDKIIHAGNPVLRWMCSNILLREDPAGNIKIDRGKSTEKVDGMVALVMALGEFMTGEQTGPSVYDERGILTL
jgi:phage terminase large subunit-like protein